tara:strand:+ start:3947 stop:4084 length:138 start_codon:yes stop_codon:yes gene_type:complete
VKIELGSHSLDVAPGVHDGQRNRIASAKVAKAADDELTQFAAADS